MAKNNTINPRFDFTNDSGPLEGSGQNHIDGKTSKDNQVKADIFNEIERVIVEISNIIGNAEDLSLDGTDYDDIGEFIKSIASKTEVNTAKGNPTKQLSLLFGYGIIESFNDIYSITGDGVDNVSPYDVPSGTFDAYIEDNIGSARIDVPSNGEVEIDMSDPSVIYTLYVDEGIGIAEESASINSELKGVVLNGINSENVQPEQDIQGNHFPVDETNTIEFTLDGANMISSVGTYDATGEMNPAESLLPIEKNGIEYQGTDYDMIIIEGNLYTIDDTQVVVADFVYNSVDHFTVDRTTGTITSPIGTFTSGKDYYVFYKYLVKRKDVIQCGLYTNEGGLTKLGINTKDGTSAGNYKLVRRDLNNIALYEIILDTDGSAVIKDIRKYLNSLTKGDTNRKLGKDGIDRDPSSSDSIHADSLSYDGNPENSGSFTSIKDKIDDTYTRLIGFAGADLPADGKYDNPVPSGNYISDDKDVKTIVEKLDTLAVNILEASSYRISSSSGVLSSSDKSYNFRNDRTSRDSHGCMLHPVYVNSTSIQISPKVISGNRWIGAVLNNNKYLERTNVKTMNFTSDDLSGLGALADQWYAIVAFENASGELDFGFVWMPKTTIDATGGSPSTSCVLNQVNSTDIGLAFSGDSRFVMWEDEDEFETPLGYIDTAAFSYDPTKELYISNRTSTGLTFNASLEKTDFVDGSIIYQVDNFKPIDYSTGNIPSAIGTRGWCDTGWRVRTDGSGNIIEFTIAGDVFIWINQSANWQGFAAAEDMALNTYIPPDKKRALVAWWNFDGSTAGVALYYAFTNYNKIVQGGAGQDTGGRDLFEVLHGITYFKYGSKNTYHLQGYER